MAKKPAHSLRADPARPRKPRYIGEYVVWWDDGNWEWLKCIACGAPLSTQKSRELGAGPSCAPLVTDAARSRVLAEERARVPEYQYETSRRWRPRPERQKPRRVDTSGPATIRLPPETPRRSRGATSKPRGITNQQAKELARLQRAAGESYSGSGLTEDEARSEIARLKRALGEH